MGALPPLHARTHLPGGSDPLDVTTSVPYAARGRSSSVTIGAGTGYDTDEFVDWQTYVDAGASDYLEEFTDGAGTKGMKILQPGIYTFTAFLDVRENNASNIVPTTLALYIATATDGGTNFGSGVIGGPSSYEGWIKHNPAGPYSPPTLSPFSGQIRLGGSFTVPLTSITLSSFNAVSCRIASEGGTDSWMYYPVALYVFRLGAIAT